MHVLIDYRGRGHGKKIKGFCSVIMIFIFYEIPLGDNFSARNY